MARHAGVIVPLFSLSSHAGWGIGELPDVGGFAAWMATGGFDRLMILPIGPIAKGETSPYSAVSAMAIDPMSIGIDAMEDFVRAGGVARMSSGGRAAREAARRSATVRYEDVRRAKREALDLAFDRFLADEWANLTPRASALAAYIARERWWLDDYALFQALCEASPASWWREWPAAIRAREPRAVDEARRQHATDVLKQQYWQWVAETQWQTARRAAREVGVTIVGDLPFVVSAGSSDVWTRQREFRLDVSVGVPPDAFTPEGQDWGLPAYDWDVIRAGGYQWIRQRAKRMAALFDAVRVDHLVGLYRTYGRPAEGEPFFNPADEASQTRQGEEILQIIREADAAVMVEDLGTVPDFVRESLARLEVPGCKVLRWERDWEAPGQPFRVPGLYPRASVAMTGTHDTASLAEWWDAAPAEERAALFALPLMQVLESIGPGDAWSDRLRDALADVIFDAGSDELFMPIQDVFGWRDRINTPGTVGPQNWTWRLPWPVEEWRAREEPRERAAFFRWLAVATDRGSGLFFTETR
jgi:4-alpha-glucanotransferase